MKKYYDAVIVGCGVAGCFAALHLPQEADILMITKADTEDSDSFLAQGGICVLKNESDYDAFYEDTMHAGHYENTPESVDIMIRSSRNVINQLIAWGVDFRRDENGELCYTKEGAHSTNRILFHDDVTGKEITSKLLAQVKKLPNVTLLAHTEMCDILSGKNGCEGVLIRDEEGKLVPVYARDVIWACGGIGGIYDNSTNFPHLTGDALAIAIHRNVALKNVNYVQIHPTTLYSQKKGRRFLISESVRGEGAVLLDKNGERFTDELQPRDMVSREIHRQMEKDHTKHVWLSLKTIPLDVKERFPNIYQKCLEEGYDITKEPIPVVPAQHYFMGGVKVDSNSETTMDHLYAAGETSCNGVHGANRLASNSLLESLVFAERAAKKMAAEWAAEGLVENADRKETATEPKEDEWKLLAKRYDIRKEDYQDMEEYAERCKESIWDAIRKMNPITRTLNVDNLLLLALQEDISSEDVTTNAVMPEACQGTVQLLCKQDGVIAGMEVFARVFTLLDEKTEIIPYVKDGDEVKKGDLLATVNGDIRVLLSGERTALNYLQRMSGIATYTRSVAKLLEGSKTTLLDTRKTTPNMRIFEKYAVKIGGGQNHRYNLSDGVLLKDNHIGAAGSVTKAIEMARDYAPFVRKIEVECENLDMVREAADAGADIIMLDNMTPAQMKEAVAVINGRAKTECSGNVTKENIATILDTGVDYVSSGALTHSAPILDVSLKNLHPIE